MFSTALMVAFLVVRASAVGGVASGPNSPPDVPTITEPRLEGQVVSYGDVHMETLPFSDPNAGDEHLCSDWEIWSVEPPELAWVARCLGGAERVHTHLRDGTFENSYAGRDALLPESDYVLRVRHRDSSKDPNTEWSAWAERTFRTNAAVIIPPLELDDISDTFPPRWVGPQNNDIFLPAAPPSPGVAPFIRIESADGAPLLELRGHDGDGNQVVNSPHLPEHTPVRIRISAGDVAGGFTLPETTLTFRDHDNESHTIYLPSITISPAFPDDVILWVSLSGATYFGDATQTKPDFTQLARSQALPWAVHQPGFRVEVVASGFQLPVNIAFVPNPGNDPDSPYFYVTELFGTIKVVTRGGAVTDYATGLLNFNADTSYGLTGIAVDPASGDVFVGLLYYSATPLPAGHFPRVVRLHSTDGGRTAATRTTVLDMFGEDSASSHTISNVTIHESKLYVHLGDAFRTAAAQDLESFRGKIIRLNLDGSAPADNPFYNAADGITARDYVYAYGFRNPFGGGWRASDGFHYEVENGPNTDRFAKVVPGRNYLWDGTEESMHEGALFTWFHAHAPTNVAFIQPQTFGGSLFPPEKMDHAFVAESGPTGLVGPQYLGKRITEFVLSPTGERLDGPRTLVEYDGVGRATVVALAAGPDGLYFSDFFKDLNVTGRFPTERGSNILRVKYVGEAEFAADLRAGPIPLTVSFSDASTVVDPVSWDWSFGDGGTSTEQNPTHTYTKPGVYDVRLSIVGAGGQVVEQKGCYIRAGHAPRVALLGSSPLSVSDQAIADHLLARGCVVQAYDAANPARPSAEELAESSDMVLIGNSSVGAAVGQEFRDIAIPVLVWNPAAVGVDRIPFSDSASSVASQGAINILNNRHAITLGLPSGVVPVYSPRGTMSFTAGTIGAGARSLATREIGVGAHAILLAEPEATLLGGHVTPARRGFLFFGSGFAGANVAGRLILDRMVDWAAQFDRPAIVAQPVDTLAPVNVEVALSVNARGSAPLNIQWRLNGVPLVDGPRYSGTRTGTLTIRDVQFKDAGGYDAVIVNECSSITSNSATLTVVARCDCDWNLSGLLNSQDFFDFLQSFFAGAADYNEDGTTNSQDFFDFISCFLIGC